VPLFKVRACGQPSRYSSINTEINSALVDPSLRLKFAEIGGAPLLGSPADFGKLLVEETEKWGKVVKFAGLKPE
jgi:tripartite-type tricarboxylate transporter receptor subunit TctC